MFMLGVTWLSTFLLVFKAVLRTLEESPLPSPGHIVHRQKKNTTLLRYNEARAVTFPNIVFIKNPKAGGSTFSGVLRRVAHHNHLSGVNDSAWITHEPGIWANHMKKKFLTQQISELKKQTFLLTIVRNPINQLLSQFYHFEVVTNNMTDSDDNIISYARNWKNIQTGYIEGRHMRSYRWNRDMSVTKYIGEALNSYNFVGVTERFNEGLVILKYMLNCSFADLLYVRSKDSNLSRGGTKPYKHLNEMSDTVKEYLTTWAAKNEHDKFLWNMANKQLDDHIQKYTHFTRDLQYFETHVKRAQEICAFVSEIDCYWEDNGCSIKCLNRYAMQHMTQSK